MYAYPFTLTGEDNKKSYFLVNEKEVKVGTLIIEEDPVDWSKFTFHSENTPGKPVTWT